MIIEFSAISIQEEEYSFYFKVNGGDEYNQNVKVSNKEIISWNCDCVFGSAYRFSKENKLNGTKCRHIKEAISLLKYLGYL